MIYQPLGNRLFSEISAAMMLDAPAHAGVVRSRKSSPVVKNKYRMLASVSGGRKQYQCDFAEIGALLLTRPTQYNLEGSSSSVALLGSDVCTPRIRSENEIDRLEGLVVHEPAGDKEADSDKPAYLLVLRLGVPNNFKS